MKISNVKVDELVSDCKWILFNINFPVQQQIRKERKVCNWNEVDKLKFFDELELDDLLDPERDHELNELIGEYENRLKATVEKVVPEKKLKAKIKDRKPWFKSDLVDLKQNVRHRERIWCKYHENHHWQAFKDLRKKYQQALKRAKRSFIRNGIDSCKMDTKQLYKLVNSLTGNKNENPLPQGFRDKDQADEFANFFVEKIENIRSNLDNFPLYEPTGTEVKQCFDTFRKLQKEEIIEIIKSLKTKSCELDAIPTEFLKRN